MNSGRALSIGNDVPMAKRRGLAVVLALLATVAACSSDHGASTATSGNSGTAAFCDAWKAAMSSGNDSTFDDVLADAPAELEDDARLVREAEASGSESSEADAAASRILNWTELNCQQGETGSSKRHIAPPIDATFEGLTFCGTTPVPSSPRDDAAGTILYGEAAVADPYHGPMLGLFWNPAAEGTHVGDGDRQPVTVHGQSGFAAPITVFQQTILPQLGTVIAWTEGDRALGLYGRGWPIGRAGELVAIANKLEEVSRGFRIPDDALPAGFGEVFSGNPAVTSLVFAPSPLYSLRFQGSNGLLDVNGVQLSESEFEAFRFFTVGVDRGEVAGHDALVGNAWNDDGPAVVTWREPDGLVVRIVGIGVPLTVARTVAEQSRQLNYDEWRALVEADNRCPHG